MKLKSSDESEYNTRQSEDESSIAIRERFRIFVPDIPATITDGKIQAEGVIDEISRFGCRLRVNTHCFSIGQKISIAAEPLGSLSGYVRWKAPGCAGIEFKQAIPEEKFSALAD